MNTGRILVITAILPLLLTVGCHRSTSFDEEEEGQRPAPAQGVVLSTARQQAIGLQTARGKYQSVQKTLAVPGWLQIKPASEVIVRATITGFVQPDVKLGSSVTKGENLASLKVFLSPQETLQMVVTKEEADTVMRQSLASLQIAKQRLKRLKQIKGGAVPETQLEDLAEIVSRSKAAYEEARDKLPFLPKEPHRLPLRLKPVPLASPLSGRITRLHVSPGQFVIAGDPLWTISDWSSLWVRVPVFEGDLPTILADQNVQVQVVGTKSFLRAKPVRLPQPTEPGRRTVDVFYEMKNAGNLRPGQAVSVSLPLQEKTKRIVILRSALLWDGNGQAWVYVQTGEETFLRKRVQPVQLPGDEVALETGLQANEKIVIVGAQTLQGEEFRGKLAVEDDD